VAANDSLVLEVKTDRNYDSLRLGFLKADNPSAFKRLSSFATLNAARTLQKPMQQAAPRGETTRNPGRLRKNIKARGVRFNKPGAVVGIKGGRTGVFYGWFVTSGRGGVRQTKEGPKSVAAVRGRPFVTDTVQKSGMLEKAMEAFSATVEKFLNDEPFRNTILKFKRGNQR
jgi:hypothetical protein